MSHDLEKALKLALKNAGAGAELTPLPRAKKKKLEDSYTSSVRPHATGVLGLKVLVYEALRYQSMWP